MMGKIKVLTERGISATVQTGKIVMVRVEDGWRVEGCESNDVGVE